MKDLTILGCTGSIGANGLDVVNRHPEHFRVRYLAARNGIPLDRAHIIGHDNVPGPDPAHVADANRWGIEMIDLLAVNLYPFEATIARPNVTLPEAIERTGSGFCLGSACLTAIETGEAPVKGMSVLKYDPSGSAAEAYRDLAKEVLNGATPRQHA